MSSDKLKIVTRRVMPNDTHELCVLLNKIIQIGGTTAIEAQLTDDEFGEYFLHGKGSLCCYVAVDALGALAGFQALGRHSELTDDWGDIATFTRISPKISGVGTALFTETRLYAKQSGMIAINATIRADNKGGLAYYDKMGFQTYSENKDIPLVDGTKIDRISKRYLLN